MTLNIKDGNELDNKIRVSNSEPIMEEFCFPNM